MSLFFSKTDGLEKKTSMTRLPEGSQHKTFSSSGVRLTMPNAACLGFWNWSSCCSSKEPWILKGPFRVASCKTKMLLQEYSLLVWASVSFVCFLFLILHLSLAVILDHFTWVTWQWLQEQVLICTSVCAVFLCVPTMECLAAFGILLIHTSVCSIFACPHNGVASSVWNTTHSCQCMSSIFVCPNNGMASSVWDITPTSVHSIFVCSNNGMASSVWDATHSHQCAQYFCVS